MQLNRLGKHGIFIEKIVRIHLGGKMSISEAAAQIDRQKGFGAQTHDLLIQIPGNLAGIQPGMRLGIIHHPGSPARRIILDRLKRERRVGRYPGKQGGFRVGRVVQALELGLQNLRIGLGELQR